MNAVVVIGPVAPFRGGIAQHTSQLATALSAIAEVQVVSFSRLYPRWLYPGKFQTEKSETPFTDADFSLDSINPFTWHRTARRVLRIRPRFVIVPWWTFFVAPCLRYICRRLQEGGVPVIMLCHNVVDHEAASWKRAISKWVLKNASGFVVQTREEERKLRDLLGEVDVLYHPHPVYDQFPAAKGLLKRRASLELLFYGFIRPYKGLDILVEAIGRVRDADIHLSIVGEPWGKSDAEWRQHFRRAGIEDRVEFVPRYVSEQETAEYFHRADAVVLPYRSATGTGVVAAAFHYLKPVIATRVGGLKDVVEDGMTGLLVAPEDAGAMALAIERFATDGISNGKDNIKRSVKRMTWAHMASCIMNHSKNIKTRKE